MKSLTATPWERLPSREGIEAESRSHMQLLRGSINTATKCSRQTAAVLAFWVGWALIAHAAAPNPPALVDPPNNATEVSFFPTLSVSVSDPDGTPLTVRFYGRPATGDDFFIVVLPDTQFYSESYPQTFAAQTQWIVGTRNSANIAYVAHVGDIVNSSAVTAQWINADAAMGQLDDPAATGFLDGIPYGVAPGNHDQPTGNYNAYFGASRFSGRSPNLFLMLCGHVSGEGRRSDLGTNGINAGADCVSSAFRGLRRYQALGKTGIRESRKLIFIDRYGRYLVLFK
jgi:hypothetical protein